MPRTWKEGSTISELRLVIREAERDWSATMDESLVERAVTALSADPVTLEELAVAVERFEKPSPGRPFLAAFAPQLCDEPHDAGLIVIDLVARLVVADSSLDPFDREGYISYHNGQEETKKWLRYHLASDWLIVDDADHWQAVAETRRRERAGQPLLDARSVFYGRPMLDFIARKTFAAFAQREAIAEQVRVAWTQRKREFLARQANVSVDQVDPGQLTDADIVPTTYPGQEIYAHPFYDTIKQIHVAWMLTPRADLGGQCPRTVAIQHHDHLTWDMQDRCDQWSSLGECPRGLDETAFAYRYGGFGTHELVKYYDLLRELLWSCWDRLADGETDASAAGDAQLPAEDAFVATEVPRLEAVRDQWLDTPDPECHCRTPRSIIDRERARLPEAVSGEDAMVDPDCPCCQMIADMPGPVFWHYDCSEMDDEFAFDIYCDTFEEWENDHRSREESDRRYEAEMSERRALGVPEGGPEGGADTTVWSASYSVGNAADVPLGVRLFGLGCNLAELIVRLRGEADRESTPAQVQQMIHQLNRDFGNLREIVQESGPAVAAALFDPVIDRFDDTLGSVATMRPDLGPQCDALTDRLATLLDEPPPAPARESFGPAS